MCAEGWDSLFEKEREFMMPLENGPFYACRQYVGAYGTLGGVLINQRMEVMTDEYKTIPGLYCVGTDACTIYGDSYNYSIPGNTMGFCAQLRPHRRRERCCPLDGVRVGRRVGLAPTSS